MAAKEKSTVITAFVFDFETGGLDPQKCAATQLSVHAVRLDTFEVMETYNMYFSPYNYKSLEKPAKNVLRSKYDTEEEKPMLYESRALEISGVTMEMLNNLGTSLYDACNELIEFFKRNTFNVSKGNKPILVGQNVLFDIGFLTQILLYTDLWGEFTKIVRGVKDYWGNFQPYYADTICLSQLAMSHDKSVNSWKLELEAEKLGIELDDAHDADADVVATREILRTLTARMRLEGTDQGSSIPSMVDNKKEKTREHFKI